MKLLRLIPLLFLTSCSAGRDGKRGWYFGPWQTKPPAEDQTNIKSKNEEVHLVRISVVGHVSGVDRPNGDWLSGIQMGPEH